VKCRTCATPLHTGLLDAPPEESSGTDGVWRYLGGPDARERISLGEAVTGLAAFPVAGPHVQVKLEGQLPTGSFKDRGMAALVSSLLAEGVDRVTIDSSGNAGAALAAYCARAGILCEVHVPETTSEGKLTQLQAYGARVVRVPGRRVAAAESARAAAARDDAVYASHAWSAEFLLGTRTFAFELVQQLGGVPDAVVIPTGAGTLYLGAYYGFKSLHASGRVTALPRLYGVQSTACTPLATAFVSGSLAPAQVEPSPGVAEGVMTASPPRGAEVLRAARATGGEILAVGDDDLWSALRALGQGGIFVEPTSALALAGYVALRRRLAVAADELVVLAATGNGLKAASVIARHVSSGNGRVAAET
jgi:threonine synthase